MKRFFLFIFILVYGGLSSFAQHIPVHIYNAGVYEFVDELANEGLIDITTVIKPYGREEIAMWLLHADSLKEKLDKRQQQELDLYLNEFVSEKRFVRKTAYDKKGKLFSLLPPVFRYEEGKGKFLFRPVGEINATVYDGLPFHQRAWGAEMQFTRGHWGVYASLRDHYLQRNIPAMPTFLVQDPGGNYKLNEGGRNGGDYSEMRGGLFYNWKWGRIGLVKDHIQWGDNYYGATILSGRTPSFPMIQLQMKPFKWLDFQYFHAWLVSEVIDSASSYYSQPGVFRGVFQPKYMAANMFTIIPWKHMHVSVGNSIVYSDKSLMWAYLIPFLFYKSVDHTLTHGVDNENSQMFLNFSTRNLKHLHAYTTLYIDEFSIKRIFDKDRYNFFNMRWGLRLSNWPLRNLSATAEYTQAFPMIYKHRLPSLTYASNQYNLGYYMGDNSTDLNVSLIYKIVGGIRLEAFYGHAIHGIDFPYINDRSVDRHPLLSHKAWQRDRLGFRVEYRPTAAVVVQGGIEYSNVMGYIIDGHDEQYYLDLWSPEYMHGQHIFYTAGISYGF
jgi:hypothetical protein